MQQRQSRGSKHDANYRLTEDFLALIRTHLNNLPPAFKSQYLVEQVFSKYVSKDTAPANVRRTRAINKWLACERTNEATNVRLLNMHEEYNILPRVTYARFMDKVREVISQTIGETVPVQTFDRLSDWHPDLPPESGILGSFSGGASTSRKRLVSFPAGKYLGQADVTREAYGMVEGILSDSMLWSRVTDPDYVRIVPGNVLFVVPKTTEIDRCACKEPDLNMYLQKGVGTRIRQALRRVGIDLNDQTRNQRLAREGSESGKYATIDLSSASDSVCTELVFQCMPIAWYSVLSSLRSRVTVIDGEEHVNEMFSSMGNGFTFELESLIFYAVARATAYFENVSGTVSVYGDDIIVPTEVAQNLIWVLSVLGFTVNPEKTFFDGPFRESCGGHYYNGYDVTPFYIRRPIDTLSELILLCNNIRRWSRSSIGLLEFDLEELWCSLADHVPKKFWGGHDFGDKGRLVSSFRPRACKRLVPVTKVSKCDLGGYLLWLDSRASNNALGNRDPFEALVTSEHSLETSRHVVRPVVCDLDIRTDDLFLTELITER